MVQKEQVDRLIGHEFPPFTHSYSARDVCLYALGVGAPADWLDPTELQFVYELSSEGFKALPTFAVTFAVVNPFLEGKIGDIEFNPMMVVHGEEDLEILNPLPTEATISGYPKISAIYDKGSGMVMVFQIAIHDADDSPLANLRASVFLRGLGGFGGERGPSGKVNLPPDHPPDAIYEETIPERQALIYRLSGDPNPLHVDSAFAALGGFDRPILHGLCSYGYAGRAVLKQFCENDPARFHSIQARFSKHVFPGETLITEMWQTSPSDVILQSKVKTRDEVVLSNARVTLNP